MGVGPRLTGHYRPPRNGQFDAPIPAQSTMGPPLSVVTITTWLPACSESKSTAGASVHDPFQGFSALHLGDQKVTWKKLAGAIT